MCCLTLVNNCVMARCCIAVHDSIYHNASSQYNNGIVIGTEERPSAPQCERVNLLDKFHAIHFTDVHYSVS